MVGVPECLKALFADLLVGGCVHHEHDKEHEVASDATGLRVVNLLRSLLANLCIVSKGVAL